MKKILQIIILFCCISPINKTFAQYGVDASFSNDFINPFHSSGMSLSGASAPKGFKLGFFTFRDARIVSSYSFIYSSSILGNVTDQYFYYPSMFANQVSAPFNMNIEASQIGILIESQEFLSGELDEKSYFYAIRGFGIRKWSFTTTYTLDNSVTNASTIADFNVKYPALTFTGYEFHGVYGYGYQYNFKTMYGAFIDAKLNYGLGYISSAGSSSSSGSTGSSSTIFYTLHLGIDIGIRARIK